VRVGPPLSAAAILPRWSRLRLSRAFRRPLWRSRHLFFSSRLLRPRSCRPTVRRPFSPLAPFARALLREGSLRRKGCLSLPHSS
jgi:hypothetical protein